ncbi:MAG: DUF1080 domain-containing protein [Bryobacteraceae bacterium]
MRTFLLVYAFCSSGLALAADAQFNGRWDISVLNEPRKRAWWLEITGAGTPQLAGRFVGFPGGNMNPIEKLSIANGVLKFSFDRAAKGKAAAVHQEYTARLAGGKLEGTFRQGRNELKWTGVRAPEIKDKDDGSWKPGKPIRLFNGKDLSGWHGMIPGKDLGWKVENGLLRSTGKANNLESDGKYWNYILHLEYRVGPQSNSGIGLRGRYEVQILEDYGRPLDVHSNGALYSRIVPAVAASKPAGEWQTYDIRLVGRDVTVTLNGKQVVKGVIEGLTAIASDPNEGEPGPLTLQGDHGPVDFRNIVLTPLTK